MSKEQDVPTILPKLFAGTTALFGLAAADLKVIVVGSAIFAAASGIDFIDNKIKQRNGNTDKNREG